MGDDAGLEAGIGFTRAEVGRAAAAADTAALWGPGDFGREMEEEEEEAAAVGVAAADGFDPDLGVGRGMEEDFVEAGAADAGRADGVAVGGTITYEMELLF